jgi:hypothetical protein
MVESKDALACLREIVVRGAPPALPAASPGEAAERIAAAAREQGLAGLLHGTLASSGVAPWPLVVLDALAQDRRNALVRGLRQLALAARVLDRLDRAGLRALPLKGAALLETLYDSEGDRTMSDVDVLVLDDWPGARRLLRADGFAEGEPADHVVVLREPGSGAVLELHHSVTSCPGLFPLDRDGLWSRSVLGPGQVRRRPCPEDLLLQLALHAAFQHGLVVSLAQWLDFRRLFERCDLDPDRLRGAVGAARAEAPLRAALHAARAVVGGPLPGWLLAAGPAPPGLAREGVDPLDYVTPAEPDLARVRFRLLPGRRTELLLRTVFPERPGERASLVRTVGRGAVRAASLLRRFGPRTLALGRRASSGRRPDLGGSTESTENSTGLSVPDAILRDCLRAFPFVELTVTGECMRPALLPGARVRLVSSDERPPRVGDVVLARHPEGLRLHRLVWGPPFALPGTSWRTQADRGALWDPALRPADVLGTVVEADHLPRASALGRWVTSLRSLWRGTRTWVRLRRVRVA